jgi:acetyl-CoA carboxylase biotin carboxyl carrier protein
MAATAAAGATNVALPDLPAGTHVIKSPMVGTFYRASEPGAKPFVEPGQRVKPDTIVCIIEVMKLMNSVEAGVAGTVTHVFAENAAMVEAGQPLVAIRK